MKKKKEPVMPKEGMTQEYIEKIYEWLFDEKLDFRKDKPVIKPELRPVKPYRKS